MSSFQVTAALEATATLVSNGLFRDLLKIITLFPQTKRPAYLRQLSFQQTKTPTYYEQLLFRQTKQATYYRQLLLQ